MAFELTCPAFRPGEMIPARYTCDGDDVSPPLRWTEPPAGTRSLALVLEDPDAPRGLWTHWLVYGIRPDVSELPEGCSGSDALPAGAAEGTTTSGGTGYEGPCPPGGTHRYFFRLAALDTEPDLPPGAGRDALLRAMDGRVLAQAELMGRYARR